MLVEHVDDADIDPPLRRQLFEGRYAVLAALVRARRCMMVDSMAVEGGPTIVRQRREAAFAFGFGPDIEGLRSAGAPHRKE